MENAVIVEGARTPIGRFLGALAEVPAVDLEVAAVRAALRRSDVAPADVQAPLLGHARRALEIVPVEVAGRKGSTTVAEDEHPRADTTLEQLARLKPVFSEDGTVTAGSSSGITDGAAAMVLMSESRARAEGRMPLARVVAYASVGVDPAYMGIGVVPATRKVLDKSGLSLQDFDVVEVNEAFAAQVLACDRELKFDHEKLNPKGGAIALGHPIGMTGARIVLTCAYELRERGAALGLATLCISGGMGMAVVLERA